MGRGVSPEALLRGQMIHKMSVHHLSDLLHECTQYPLCLPDEPNEGRNNFLRLFGQLDGNHHFDLLLLPFLPLREEKEVGLRGPSSRESSRSVVGVIPWVGAYRIRPPEALLRGQMIHKMSVYYLSDLLHKCTQSPLCLPDEPDEGQNNFLHPSGQLDGDHRLDLLLFPFLPSREEKEVCELGRIPRGLPNEPLCLPDE